MQKVLQVVILKLMKIPKIGVNEVFQVLDEACPNFTAFERIPTNTVYFVVAQPRIISTRQTYADIWTTVA